MRFTFISIFPEMIEQATSFGIIGQSIKKDLFEIDCVNPRDFTSDVHKTVDDKPYGGGDGMLMLYEPLEKAIKALKLTDSTSNKRIIHLSPQGQKLTDRKAKELSDLDHIVWVCSRYAGVDQRFINSYIDEEISIGDFVISGGEMAAMVATDAVARKIPGVLGNASSVDNESFAQDGLLEAPQYSRPELIGDQNVPEVLLSGHHKNIESWQRDLSLLRTISVRLDLLDEARIEIKDLENALNRVNSMDRSQMALCGLLPDIDYVGAISQRIEKMKEEKR